MDVFFLFSCGPTNGGEMVSRRKILSRSRDDLHMEAPPDEEDVWYQKEKLFKVQPNKENIWHNIRTYAPISAKMALGVYTYASKLAQHLT